MSTYMQNLLRRVRNRHELRRVRFVAHKVKQYSKLSRQLRQRVLMQARRLGIVTGPDHELCCPLPLGLFQEVLTTIARYQPSHSIFSQLHIDAQKLLAGSYSDRELKDHQLMYGEKPGLFDIYKEAASFLMNTAQHRLASKLYRTILDKHADKVAHSLYLQTLVLSEESTNESLLIAHKEWVARYAKVKPLSPHTNDPNPHRKLRIGFLCHFFDHGVSVNGLLPMLARHNPERFEIYCYDDGNTSAAIKSATPHHWRNIRKMSDEEVAHLIKKDQIDILQEANGHCHISRYCAAAYSPAPIQISWYNHAATTGMPAITHVTTDDVSIIDSDLPYFTEQVYRKKGFYGAVALRGLFKDINPSPPHLRNGYVTFGCLGSTHKITQYAIRLWSEVLKKVPDSRMLIKGGALQFTGHREAFLQQFEANGIDRKRIITQGPSKHEDMLQAFQEIDIMLDTFPSTGGTTMFEALWNGIPPITLRGNRWVERTGSAILTTLGRTELIALTPEEFVEKAVALANSSDRIAAYRKDLRPQMSASSLTNVESYRDDLETAYTTLWQEWCAVNQHAAAA